MYPARGARPRDPTLPGHPGTAGGVPWSASPATFCGTLRAGPGAPHVPDVRRIAEISSDYAILVMVSHAAGRDFVGASSGGTTSVRFRLPPGVGRLRMLHPAGGYPRLEGPTRPLPWPGAPSSCRMADPARWARSMGERVRARARCDSWGCVYARARWPLGSLWGARLICRGVGVRRIYGIGRRTWLRQGSGIRGWARSLFLEGSGPLPCGGPADRPASAWSGWPTCRGCGFALA